MQATVEQEADAIAHGLVAVTIRADLHEFVTNKARLLRSSLLEPKL